MLPSSSTCHSFVAPALWNREPLQGKQQGSFLCQHHTREGWCHLGPETESSTSFVCKVIKLLCDFFSGLANVQFNVFDNGGVILLESIPTSCISPNTKKPRLQTMVVRVKVARALRHPDKKSLMYALTGNLATVSTLGGASVISTSAFFPICLF